ncbi:hypothetical protein E1301_Tti004193 [Triplophysa tibetana]|uniref:Uncharacterized protein n=1 Tax=Triplophysa tibetana TaxID=1572043 RepID=A0A5A9NHB0_9TELE|nr:hypothetical protein E1301_Tti004193 [Triplophysa tibetana]
MEMRPWIFIRRGRCPLACPGEEAGQSGPGERGGEALLPAAGGPRFGPTRPSPTTLNCPCNELLDGGPSQACSSIVCWNIPGLNHGNRASWEQSQGSRWATVTVFDSLQGEFQEKTWLEEISESYRLPSDKQRLLKEVFHKQILPAGQWLKRSFLSPSSGTQPIEPAPGSLTLRRATGQRFAPRALGHPHVVLGHLCPPTPSVGTLHGEPCYLNQLGLKLETKLEFRPKVSVKAATDAAAPELTTPHPGTGTVEKDPVWERGMHREGKKRISNKARNAFESINPTIGELPLLAPRTATRKVSEKENANG